MFGATGSAYVGDSLQAGVSLLGDAAIGPHAPGGAYVGATLQVGVSRLGRTEPPHHAATTLPVLLGGNVGHSVRVGHAATAVTLTAPSRGKRIRAPYRPGLLHLYRMEGGATVGTSLRAGTSKLGDTVQDMVEVRDVSAIDLTDGYEVGDGNVLSIDPLTGSATISHRVHPAPGDRVQDFAATHELYTGDAWELRYGDAIVAQGVVLQVESRASSEGQYWVKQTRYVLGGWASRMLADTASWTALPAEGSLTRLRRFRAVDTSLLSNTQRAYLDTVTAPAETDPGSSTLLDLARAFSAQTKFPVRTANSLGAESAASTLIVVPAVTFQGADPPVLYLSPPVTWTLDAEFLSDQARGSTTPTEKVQTVEVIKDFDMFISGTRKQALTGGQLGVTAILGQIIVGTGDTLSVDVGVRAPAAINLFGTLKVISQINHQFTNTYYRSSLGLTVPAVI